MVDKPLRNLEIIILCLELMLYVVASFDAASEKSEGVIHDTGWETQNSQNCLQSIFITPRVLIQNLVAALT